ncbi:MAG: rRNA maturation RNase YbeY [Saprospiraceae bacterium]
MSLESFSSGKAEIHFFCEEIEFELKNESTIINWISDVFHLEKKELDTLNYIFCSDKYLHEINLQYLNHDTLTDIITFPNSKKGKPISGDIFISIDRVIENAKSFEASFEKELLRVLIHGSLHLMGYKDKTEMEQTEMTTKENLYIDYFSKNHS